MKKKQGIKDKHQQFTRRAIVFAGVKVVAMSALVGRLYYLQFIKAEEYTTMAEGNSIKLQLIPPPRGHILDRHDIPMAENQKNFRLFLEPDFSARDEKTLSRLEQVITLDEDVTGGIRQHLKKSRVPFPILIKEHLTWAELSQVEFNTPELPGVFIDVGEVRHYPFKEVCAHMIGFVGKVDEKELTDDPLLRLPDFKIGKDGAEKLLEQKLQGTAGIKHVEVNVHGLPVRELSTKPSVPGKDINLTIDARLQEFAANRLGEESGGIVVMNVRNGNMLALVAQPGFDPNKFSMGITRKYWAELNENKKHPLVNKALAGQYPPGSTFKMIVGLAALEEKLIGPESTVFCPGHFFLGSHMFRCWKQGGHGTVNVHDALAQSCDTFFYHMAQKLGIEKIAGMARKFGLGDVTGLGLPGEKTGIVPDPDWKNKRYHIAWQGGDTINVGIGQGYVLTTPIQLALMTARIANGGKRVVPRLFVPEEDKNKPLKLASLDIDPDNLRQIQIGMEMVTTSQRGTAYGSRIPVPEMAFAGKTGTSQVRKLFKQGMKQELLPWEYRHHALFVGYAPIAEPRFAIAVMIEHGGGGASAAAPVARDVLWKIQQLEAEDHPESAPAGADAAIPAETATPESTLSAPADDIPTEVEEEGMPQ